MSTDPLPPPAYWPVDGLAALGALDESSGSPSHADAGVAPGDASAWFESFDDAAAGTILAAPAAADGQPRLDDLVDEVLAALPVP